MVVQPFTTLQIISQHNTGIKLSFEQRDATTNVQFGHKLFAPSPLVFRSPFQLLHVNCSQHDADSLVSCKRRAEQQQPSSISSGKLPDDLDTSSITKQIALYHKLNARYIRKQIQVQQWQQEGRLDAAPAEAEPEVEPEAVVSCNQVISAYELMFTALSVLPKSDAKVASRVKNALCIMLRKVAPSDDAQAQLFLKCLNAVWHNQRELLFELGREYCPDGGHALKFKLFQEYEAQKQRRIAGMQQPKQTREEVRRGRSAHRLC